MRKFSRVSSEWRQAVFGKEDLPIRVLIVADGDLNFIEDQDEDFSLSMFCEVLENSASPWETIKVTTAHRKPPSSITNAKFTSFRFDTVVGGAPIFSIDLFEEVWLFGFDGEGEGLAIAPSEVDAIETFMKKGGGVFATGDHEDLGCAMCGNLPRVRNMRRWHFNTLTKGAVPAPSKTGPTRIDTLREGLNPGFEKDDQKDAIPQEIRPKFLVDEVKGVAEPHELLATGGFAITILPDHMHEGECVSPTEIKRRATEDEAVATDFPKRSDTNEEVWPEVVAISSSAGGSFDPNEGIRPVEPRCYIVISAYDGHKVSYTDANGVPRKLGRVVVDASFHHFVNVNLKGFFNNQGPLKTEFQIISRYYRNILRYLQPPDTQRMYFLYLLRGLRFSSPFLEELQNLSSDKWENVVYAGTLTKKVISNDFSAAHARRCALAMISDVDPNLRHELEDIIDIWKPRNEPEDKFFFLNSDAVLTVILGHAMLGLASSLPNNHFDVSEALSSLTSPNTELQASVDEKLHQNLGELQKRIGRLREALKRLSNNE